MAFTTERLLMRPLTTADIAVLHPMLKKDKVAQYLDMETHQTLADTQALVEGYLNDSGKIPFAITTKTDGQVLGAIILKMFEGNPKEYEITIFMDDAHWGKGYMSEIFATLPIFAKNQLGIATLIAGCLVLNVASNAVLCKNGFLLDHVEYYPDCPEGLNYYKRPL